MNPKIRLSSRPSRYFREVYVGEINSFNGYTDIVEAVEREIFDNMQLSRMMGSTYNYSNYDQSNSPIIIINHIKEVITMPVGGEISVKKEEKQIIKKDKKLLL